MRSLTRSVGGLLTTTLVAAAPSSAAADSTAPDGTACPHASTRQPQLDLGAFERSVKCLINHERRRRDRVSLRDDGALDRAARRHAQDMVRRQYFAHVSPGGSRMVDRLRRAGYATLQRTGRGWSAAEVIAWGVATRSTARATVDAWMRSEPHRAALLNPDLRQFGAGAAAGTPNRHDADGVTAAVELGRAD